MPQERFSSQTSPSVCVLHEKNRRFEHPGDAAAADRGAPNNHVRRGQVVQQARRVRPVSRGHRDVHDASRSVERLLFTVTDTFTDMVTDTVTVTMVVAVMATVSDMVTVTVTVQVSVPVTRTLRLWLRLRLRRWVLL